jgi:oxygen-independent coproporphyrinogen-3 oxidase
MSETTAITVKGQCGSARAPLSDPHTPARSLYIHVPFCFHKCHYCDFYSFVDSQDRQAAFVDTLQLELRRLADHAGSPRSSSPELDTLFVGGGTPSLLRPELWDRILATLDELFHTRARGRSGAMEFTIECNPETVTPELMAIYAAGGVNRVSVGAQSFNEKHLKTLERWHDPANVTRALELARDAGIARRSIDLIFGIPGQTIDDWHADLDRALALANAPGLDHLSCYALTYEPNTAMTARLQRGDFTPTDDDTETRMYQDTVSRLREAGFSRYEVSNYACSDASACRHNLAYWRHDQWLAAGPSASAFIAGHRWKNVPRLADWLDAVNASGGYAPIVDHETPDALRLLAERLMTGLRLAEGVDAAAILSHAERHACDEAVMRCARTHADAGMLELSDARWTPTDRGFLFADAIAADFMQAIDDSANRKKKNRV